MTPCRSWGAIIKLGAEDWDAGNLPRWWGAQGVRYCAKARRTPTR